MRTTPAVTPITPNTTTVTVVTLTAKKEPRNTALRATVVVLHARRLPWDVECCTPWRFLSYAIFLAEDLHSSPTLILHPPSQCTTSAYLLTFLAHDPPGFPHCGTHDGIFPKERHESGPCYTSA